ncbi:hypothetical protein JXR93_05210 [bacterium]|nr:hypothetical protein [bacterium]
MCEEKKKGNKKIQDIVSRFDDLKESLQEKIDELKETLQKNFSENFVKLRELGHKSQEEGKKYVENVLNLLPLKSYIEKFRDNDYVKLASQIQKDLEKKFGVGIDKILNAFSIASTLDTEEIHEKLEELQKELKALKKEISKGEKKEFHKSEEKRDHKRDHKRDGKKNKPEVKAEKTEDKAE